MSRCSLSEDLKELLESGSSLCVFRVGEELIEWWDLPWSDLSNTFLAFCYFWITSSLFMRRVACPCYRFILMFFLHLLKIQILSFFLHNIFWTQLSIFTYQGDRLQVREPKSQEDHFHPILELSIHFCLLFLRRWWVCSSWKRFYCI